MFFCEEDQLLEDMLTKTIGCAQLSVKLVH